MSQIEIMNNFLSPKYEIDSAYIFPTLFSISYSILSEYDAIEGKIYYYQSLTKKIYYCHKKASIYEKFPVVFKSYQKIDAIRFT